MIVPLRLRRWLQIGSIAAVLALAVRPVRAQCEGDEALLADPTVELTDRPDDGAAGCDGLSSPLETSPAAGSDANGVTSSSTSAGAAHRADRALAIAALVLGGVLAWQLGRRRGRARRSLWAWLCAPRWSAYVAGAGLGVAVALTEGLLGRPLSASGAFDRLAAYPGRALFPDAPYYAHVMTPAITWPVWLMVGVLGGAFASSRLSHQAHVTWLPDAQWVPRFGASRARRLLVAFGGAMLVQIGAGIAGGCTSGLAISGGALLAPAAFAFMAGMFAGGLPTAAWWYRRRS